ncbi:Fic family protein [Actinotalea sp. AC32]|nr:Fic family protein [Actinotalea sp. AC32]
MPDPVPDPVPDLVPPRPAGPPVAPHAGPHPLRALATLDGVAAAVDDARRACEELRWHRALRRQWPVARTEAGVRAAHASAAVDGVRVPLGDVRDVARGAAVAPTGPAGDTLLGALRAQAEVERLMVAPGATQGRGLPFAQLLARVHLAAVGAPARDDAAGGAVGRPRGDGDVPGDLHGLGPAPDAVEVAGRLRVLAEVVDAPPAAAVPALVVAAVAHGELLALRPFAHGNGVVARAVFRHLLTAGGVDPVGVVVPDVRWAQEPLLYVSTAARFATGTPDGVAAWLAYCASSVRTGADEGRRVADAVLAGRLTDG